MVKAIFKKKSFWSIVCLLCGLFLISSFVFFRSKDSEATMGSILTAVIFGTIFCIFNIAFLLFNFRAYLSMENGHIKGKYHFFGRINCDISEVDFALSQINTVTIPLRNGKRHMITGVENSWVFSSAIRRQIFQPEAEAPDDIRLALEAAQAARKRELFYVFGGVALMFVNIFIAALLTGGRRLLRIEQLKYRLKGANIASQPLPPPPGKSDPCLYGRKSYRPNCCFTLPDNSGVYYCVQEFFGSSFRLDAVHTSEVCESENALAEEADFYTLIDITAHFQ